MILLTQNAADEIARIRSQEKETVGVLRVSVVGGGCSGMSYKLQFESAPKEQDKIFEDKGVTVVVDSKSYLYLKGMTLDYKGGLNGTGFSFSNPNATKHCGCGTSFAVS